MDPNTILSIKSNELFEGMTEAEITLLMNCIHPKERRYAKGEYVATPGMPYTGIGLVVSGSVLMADLHASGASSLIHRAQTGGLFGEAFAFAGIEKWPISVLSETDSHIIFIDPTSIFTTCSKGCAFHRQFTANMLKILSLKTLSLKSKLDLISIKSMRGRLSAYLLRQYRINESTTFSVEFNRQELADYLQVTRSSMSRELSRMKDEGIIDFYKNTFKILDLTRLV